MRKTAYAVEACMFVMIAPISKKVDQIILCVLHKAYFTRTFFDKSQEAVADLDALITDSWKDLFGVWIGDIFWGVLEQDCRHRVYDNEIRG